MPESLDAQISCLVDYLREARCLLILDNAESLLSGEQRTGQFRPGYEGYGQLFRSVGGNATSELSGGDQSREV